MPHCEVVDPKSGDCLVRIEYFQEFDPRAPTIFDKFINQRHPYVASEVRAGTYKTIVYDSISSLGLISRVHSKYFLSPQVEDQRKHYGYETAQLEELVCLAASGLNCNVVMICHVDSDKDEVKGTFVHNPAFPGKLRQRVAKDYSEFYYQFSGYDEKGGQPYYLLQTGTHDAYHAATQINAPDPCPAEYEALWSRWSKPRRPIHCLTYGEPGAGKSTFAATFPKPMLVFLFDGLGKDTPYLNLGLASSIVE